MKPRNAIMPAGHLGTKRMGELAELGFMYRAASFGFGVARPYGDSHPYDFLLQHGRRLLRVQVKSCFTRQRGVRRMGFPVMVSRPARHGLALYTQEDIDFIVAYIAPHDVWYVIPIEALGRSRAIRLYPGGKKTSTGGFYEQYREAWHLLKDESNCKAAAATPEKNRRSLREGPASAGPVPAPEHEGFSP